MMKHTQRLRFLNRAFLKPLGSLTLALSAIVASHTASATTQGPNKGDPKTVSFWCLGDGTTHPTIPGYPADSTGLNGSNPADTWDGWGENPLLTNWWPSTGTGFGDTAETPAPSAPNQNDRYAIQLNYWNSVANSTSLNANAPFGYSTGQSCLTMAFNNYMSDMSAGSFTITYPADPPKPRAAEQTWASANSGSYPWYGTAPYANGPTQGGPTGYVSTFKGCSWDSNSCTQGSAVATSPGAVTKSADTNVFPEKLADITSIPTQWSILFNHTYGAPETKDHTKQAWDASYDIWFDTDADTGNGKAPYGNARGQNDGLEIMVWMNHNGSYVDTAQSGSFPSENQSGYIQPTGHIRERVMINSILYDVWVGRLDNPYFSRTTGTVIAPAAEPYTCPTLPSATCGTEWNVVSFVSTKDSNGTDYRATTMTMDTKIFTDYILGIQDGLWQAYGTATDGSTRGANSVLKCPASAMNQDLSAPTQDCLSANWYLMSIQAGFETWIGGNGLGSYNFKAHVLTNSTGIQTGLRNDKGDPIIHWQTPFDVVYSGCTSQNYSANNHAAFTITGTNNDTGAAITYPSNGMPIDMGAEDPTTKLFTYYVKDPLYPMHGDAVIHFTSACGNTDVPVFIDPSGKVFYSDGKTPVVNASVSLLRSSSGTASGPYAAVPNHNSGLSTPVMQPDDNTQNSMLSTGIGSYAWNVIPGWYEVNAQLANCGSVTTTAQQVTATHAIENLNITLPCAAPKPLPPPPTVSNGVTVQLTVNGVDWQNGYCRNVVLTNTTSKPVTWKVNFNLPFTGNVTQTWNMNYSKSGNTITAWGVGWNNMLQPGQVLNTSGFCATK